MADIQYINYGDLQVDLLALLNKMADLVAIYVDKQPWSRKRKEKFMSAYSDMLSRGIVGADSNTGQWVITVNGDDLNVDNLPKKDKLMYQEAAYFIKNQMASLAQAKPEEKKEEKTPYGNFREGFLKHVSNNVFGGNPVETEKWNNFDERNLFGIRDTKNRTEMLSKLLLSYSDSITDDKFNFEGTPYKNATELKGKILNAINALGTETKQDDLESFYALGLDPDEWFNNGSGDASGHFRKNGTQFTNGEYYQYLKDKAKKAKLAKKKLSDEELKSYESLLNTLNNTNTTLLGVNGELLLRFGSTESNNYDYNTTGLIADITSMLGDVVSLSGGIPGLAGGATTLVSDVVGDIAKGKDFLSTLGHAGGNLLWGLAGFVPGVKTGKLIKTGARIYSALAAYGLLNDENVRNSWGKIAKGDFSNISNKDIENYKWTLHVLTGGINAARGARTDRQVTARVKNTTGEIRLTNGQTKTLDKKLFDEIKLEGRRKGNKAAMDKLRKELKLKEGEDIAEGLFNFSEKGLSRINPGYWSLKYRDYAGSRWYIPGRSHADIIDLGKTQQLRALLATQPNRSFRSAFTRNGDVFFSRTPRLEMSLSLNRYLPRELQFSTQPFSKKYKQLFNLLKSTLLNFSYFALDADLNTLKTLNNALIPPKSKLTRQTREIAPSKTKVNGKIQYGPSNANGKLIDGSDYNITYMRSNNVPEMVVTFKGQNVKIEGSTLGLLKQNLGKWINEQNIKILLQNTTPLKANDLKWKDFVSSVRELKRLGYLYKQGGKITDKLIDNFLKQYNHGRI